MFRKTLSRWRWRLYKILNFLEYFRLIFSLSFVTFLHQHGQRKALQKFTMRISSGKSIKINKTRNIFEKPIQIE
jgi:hypothetical protein